MRKRHIALILSLVPGWGHVYWGRETPGLVWFTVWAVLAFAWLNGLVVYQGPGRVALVFGAGGACLVVGVIAFLDLLRRTRPGRVESEIIARRDRLERGARAYVRDELDAAASAYRECLRADPHDVDALFRLGVVCARSGAAKDAKRYLRRAIRRDLADKWRWEIERELSRLEAGSHRPRKTAQREEEAEPASA